jgi:hypothetical protein
MDKIEPVYFKDNDIPKEIPVKDIHICRAVGRVVSYDSITVVQS